MVKKAKGYSRREKVPKAITEKFVKLLKQVAKKDKKKEEEFRERSKNGIREIYKIAKKLVSSDKEYVQLAKDLINEIEQKNCDHLEFRKVTK